MLIAINAQGVPEQASPNCRLRRDEYYCPACASSVMFRSGPKTIPHFAHRKNQLCEVASDPESIEHLTGKLQLFKQLQLSTEKCQLEKYFPQIKQKSDIYFEYCGSRVAVEFQCSSISLDRLNERTLGYLSISIIPIWIFHISLLKVKYLSLVKLSKLVQQGINDSGQLYFFDPIKEACVILSQLAPFSVNQYFTNINRIALINLLPNHLLDFHTAVPTYFHNWRLKRHHHLVKSIRFEGLRVPFYQKLYQSGLHASQLPIFVGIPLPSGILLQTPAVEWQGRIFLALYLLKTTTPTSTKQLFQQMIDKREIVVQESVVPGRPTMIALAEYLEVLKKVGFITFENGILSVHHEMITQASEEKLYQFLRSQSWRASE